MTLRPSTRAWERLTDRQREKAARWQCISPRCRNRVDKRNQRLVCCTCSSRSYASRNAIRVKWLNLKKSAKRRGIEFLLEPFDAFECWAAKYGYTQITARGAEGLTVDRKDENGAYTWANIQTLTNSENARKAAEFRRAAFVPYYQQLQPF
jgi:hypothetical protein